MTPHGDAPPRSEANGALLRSRLGRRALLVIASVAVVVSVVGYPVLMHEVSARLARCLHARGVAVEVGGPIGVAHLLLTGRTGQVRVSAASADLDGLVLRHIDATATQVHVSPGWLWGRPRARARSLRAAATVTEADLNAALRAHHVPLDASLGPGGLSLAAKLGGLDLARVQSAVEPVPVGRQIEFAVKPDLLPGIAGIHLPATFVLATLPDTLRIDRLSFGRGSLSAAVSSNATMQFNSCPA